MIINNLEQLLRITEYHELVNKCQEKRLLSNVMVTNIEEDAGVDINNRHKQLLIKLTQRGPKAYNILLEICKELGYNEAYKFLKPASYIGFTDIKKNNEKQKQEWQRSQQQHQQVPTITLTRPSTTEAPIELKEYKEDLENEDTANGNEPTKNIVTLATEIKTHNKDNIPLETYNMTSNCRGVLFLVNIIEFQDFDRRRNGADVDKKNLISLFRQMGFQIFYYENLFREQFDLLLNQFSRSNFLRRPDCLVFALLTHGSMNGHSAYAEFSDGGSYKVEDIIQFFSNTNCMFLIGKPKIFLFPFCRGNKPDRELNITVIEKREVQYDGYVPVTKRYPSFSDILICYATVPGYETHRDQGLGSWYIQKFCLVLAQYAHNSSFEEMLKIIHQKVGEIQTSGTNIQTPSFESRGFNKVLYFNPGFPRARN